MNAWDFVDALLEESERKNQPCSFPPAQVTKLRQMIAEIPTDSDGRKRGRFVKGSNKFVQRTIRLPEDLMFQLDKMAADKDVSFNVLIADIGQQYIERTEDEL